jgi:hypothetical protein
MAKHLGAAFNSVELKPDNQVVPVGRAADRATADIKQ